MCGIVGTYNPIGAVCSNDILSTMRDRMIHRGPDGSGLWRAPDERCALGHRRLSIIDLSENAAQPMSNTNGTVVLTYNGEIYNHADIRRELEALDKYAWKTDHSDTEVLLHAYEEWGLACVERFYGMFSCAIYDTRDPSRPALHLMRDRIGIKPLYLTKTQSGEWLFASEIKALLCHPNVPREMDRTAFWHYLTFIVAPAPMTLFKGIFKIPPGHSVTIDHTGRARASRYWDCRPDTETRYSENDLGYDEAVDELTRLMKQSISRRMVSDVPFGVLLSGGVDSSLNVALMSELMDRPVSTFTVGYEDYEDFNEFQYARKISERYQTSHHETMINEKKVLDFLPNLVELQDEPIADNVCIPLYFLAGLVRDSGTTVVQVGEGADENFLGYWWCDHYRDKEQSLYGPTHNNRQSPWWQQLFAKGKAALPIPGSDEDHEFLRRAEAGEQMFWGGAAAWVGKSRLQLTPDISPFAGVVDCPVEGLMPDSHRLLDSHSVVDSHLGALDGRVGNPETPYKIPFLESKIRLPEHLLMRVDKMTMAHSVEARVPFLDHDVVEFAMRLPAEYKLDRGIGKKILKKAAEPYVDHDLLYRRKQGFGAPIEKWLTDREFGNSCLDAFQRSPIRSEGFLDNDYFGTMLKEQVSGQRNHSFLVWVVLNAVLWHERWIS